MQNERTNGMKYGGLKRRQQSVEKRIETLTTDFERRKAKLEEELELINMELDLISSEQKAAIVEKAKLDCTQLQRAIDEFIVAHREEFKQYDIEKAKQRLYVRKEKRAALQSQNQAVTEENTELTNPLGQNEPVVNQEGGNTHENA